MEKAKFKTVIVNSFHSTSVNFLRKYSPEVIISLDSHLDFFFGIGEKSVQVINQMPEEWADCLTRTCTHFFIRPNVTLAKVIVVVPEVCTLAILDQALESGMMTAPQLVEMFGNKRTDKIEIEKVVESQMRALGLLGLTLHTSPPSTLAELANEVRGQKLALDVDADYMEEFQDLCFSKAPRKLADGFKGRIGTAYEVLKFVERANPGFITFSESKSGGAKEWFLRRLKKAGYQVEVGQLLDDRTAEAMVKTCDDFWKSQIQGVGLDLNLEQFKNRDEALAHELGSFAEKHGLIGSMPQKDRSLDTNL